MSALEAARNRGALWVGNYVHHYAGDFDPDDPWAHVQAARDMIADALRYADDVVLRHHLPSDGSAHILEQIAREFPALAD